MVERRRYRQNPTIPAREVGGITAVITPRTSRIHRLNQVGAEVWRACEGGGATLDELVGVVAKRFVVDEERAREDIQAFLKDAIDKGLILV
ncbi:MAG: hypothetical protein CMH57_08540 [Myxococcales bacterium]|nr:hypothetical protein [Myxococcales bacterium]